MGKFDAGYFIITDPGSDIPVLEDKTYQCCHCGAHFTVRKGSGKIRGYCSRCDGWFCGPECEKCVPVEALLENIENGRPLDSRPVVVGLHGTNLDIK